MYVSSKYKPTVPNVKIDCPFCKGIKETEIHFLLVCPKYHNLREELIPQKYYKNLSLSCFGCLIANTTLSISNKVALFLLKPLPLETNPVNRCNVFLDFVITCVLIIFKLCFYIIIHV